MSSKNESPRLRQHFQENEGPQQATGRMARNFENSKPVIISQHRRSVFNEDGTLQKMEMLQCIRTKDSDPSFIQNHPAITQAERQEGQSSKAGFRKTVRLSTAIFCVAVVFSLWLASKTLLAADLSSDVQSQAGVAGALEHYTETPKPNPETPSNTAIEQESRRLMNEYVEFSMNSKFKTSLSMFRKVRKPKISQQVWILLLEQFATRTACYSGQLHQDETHPQQLLCTLAV